MGSYMASGKGRQSTGGARRETGGRRREAGRCTRPRLSGRSLGIIGDQGPRRVGVDDTIRLVARHQRPVVVATLLPWRSVQRTRSPCHPWPQSLRSAPASGPSSRRSRRSSCLRSSCDPRSARRSQSPASPSIVRARDSSGLSGSRLGRSLRGHRRADAARGRGPRRRGRSLQVERRVHDLVKDRKVSRGVEGDNRPVVSKRCAARGPAVHRASDVRSRVVRVGAGRLGWSLASAPQGEVRDPRESGSQEEDPQGAICMHLSCTPPEFCLVTLSIREHDHGA